MSREIQRLGLRLVAGAFVGLTALAQTQVQEPKTAPFPLSASAHPLDQKAINEAIETARASDVDSSLQAALLYKGLMLFQEEKFVECIPFLEETLRQDPSLQAAWEGLGWAYIRTGEPERALQLWQYFEQLMPDQYMPHNLLAQMDIMRQDWASADRHLKKAIEIKPESFDLRFWYAQNLLRIGAHAEAEKILRQLLKEEPDRLDVHINLSRLLTHNLEYDEALSLSRHVNAELPGNTSFMMDQAVLELRVGEVRAADQLCLDVLALEPSNMRAMMLRADIAEIADMTEMSVERMQKVIDATTDVRERGALRVRMANRCSTLNKRKPGMFKESFIQEQIRTAIDENPSNVGAQMLYAERSFEMHQYGEAKKWAVHVLEKQNRHNLRAKNLLFEIALIEKRFDAAEQILSDRYKNYDSTDPLRLYHEARLLVARGDYQEALHALDRIEAICEQGTVLTLLYHDLTESDWMPVTSVRRLREHLFALKQEGFTVVSPEDIPSIIGLKAGARREEPELQDTSVPWTALMIDQVRYGITGEHKFKTGRKAKEYARPMKTVVVTFDDALRSAFLLGSSVAEEVGAPFGMFAITKPSAEYSPSVAGWAEIKEYVAGGAWVVGSHLYAAHYLGAADREGKDMMNPLPNRVWLPNKDRLESMNEWDKRMRYEFRESRRVINESLGDDVSKVAMVAYPFGDIGQEGNCNLSLLRNPIQSIVSEAGRTYKLGFVQGFSGYTVAGDNPLMCRRYEPSWYDEGEDVVRHAYESHPLFLARRTRMEIAFLMNKPRMAEEMLAVLRRDGYPEELCRTITGEGRARFRNQPMREVLPLVASSSVSINSAAGSGPTVTAYGGSPMRGASTDMTAPYDPFAQVSVEGQRSDIVEVGREGVYQEGRPDPWVALAHPFVGGEVSHSEANDQFEILRYGGRGGLYLNHNLQLSAEYFESEIEQRILPRWNALNAIDLNDVQTYLFKAFRRELRGRLTYRTQSGAVLSGSLALLKFDVNRDDTDTSKFEDTVGSKKFEASEDDGNIVIGDLSANWSPRDNLNMYVFYARDAVVSGIKNIQSDSIGAIARWKPRDSWHMTARGQYWSYEDDNAMVHMQADSFWETSSDLGLWAGLDLSTTSSSEPSDYYWTPYWDQRIMAVLRYLHGWEGYSFRFDLLAGLQRDGARPARTADESVLSAKSQWENAWGFSSAYNKHLWGNLDLYVDASVMALREYIEHRVSVGLTLGF